MQHDNLRSEFLSIPLSNLSDEEKDLRKDLPSNDYIDIMKYIEWLEDELVKARSGMLGKPGEQKEINFKRTK